MPLPPWDPELLAMLMAPAVAPTTLLERVAFSRPGWMSDAACKEHPEVEFVPPQGRTEANANAARAICAGCLCRDACLAYALADDSLLGIWAGTTTAERRELRRAEPIRRAS